MDPKQPVTITIWHYYSSQLTAVIEEYITDFNNTVGLEQGIIVQALYKEDISTNMLKTHNSHIYAKLDISSRDELLPPGDA